MSGPVKDWPALSGDRNTISNNFPYLALPVEAAARQALEKMAKIFNNRI
jgi:hypothetical protein